MAQTRIFALNQYWTQSDIDTLQNSPFKDAMQGLLNTAKQADEEQARFAREERMAKTPQQAEEVRQKAETAAEKAAAKEIEERARAERAEREEAAKAARTEREERAKAERAERTASASTRRREREMDLARQRERQARAGRGAHEAFPVRNPGLTSTSVIRNSPEVRFLDAAVAFGFGGGSAVWSATRPTEQSQLLWSAFWTAAGGIAAVEAGGSFLRAGGYGLVAGNGAFLGLKLFQLLKR